MFKMLPWILAIGIGLCIMSIWHIHYGIPGIGCLLVAQIITNLTIAQQYFDEKYPRGK
jgi:hypothetical protein